MRSVDETVKREAARNPDRAIYLMGESFGAILALAVAARNPEAYLHLVLVNPGESLLSLYPSRKTSAFDCDAKHMLSDGSKLHPFEGSMH